MNNLKFKHKNAYTINTADNSAEFDLYNMAGNVIDTFLIDLEDVDYIANYKWSKSQYGVENYKVKNLARFIAARYIEDLNPSQKRERKITKTSLRKSVTLHGFPTCTMLVVETKYPPPITDGGLSFYLLLFLCS